jgi:hypothetical protein
MKTNVCTQFLIVAVSALLLAGCGQDKQEPAAQKPAVEKPAPVEQIPAVVEETLPAAVESAAVPASGDQAYAEASAIAEEIADILIAGPVDINAVVEREPGKSLTVAGSLQAKAVIESINMDTRTVIVKTENGEQKTFVAGPAAQHLDKLAVGNKVTVTIVEACALYLGAQAESTAGTAEAVLRPEGDTPGGMFVSAGQVTAMVRALDKDARTCELEMPGGEVKALTIREGIDLTRVKVGDSITVETLKTIVIEVKQ